MAPSTRRDVLEVCEQLVEVARLHDFPLTEAAAVERILVVFRLDHEAFLAIGQSDVGLHSRKPGESRLMINDCVPSNQGTAYPISNLLRGEEVPDEGFEQPRHSLLVAGEVDEAVAAGALVEEELTGDQFADVQKELVRVDVPMELHPPEAGELQ